MEQLRKKLKPEPRETVSLYWFAARRAQSAQGQTAAPWLLQKISESWRQCSTGQPLRKYHFAGKEPFDERYFWLRDERGERCTRTQLIRAVWEWN
jgi:hypothetical protein